LEWEGEGRDGEGDPLGHRGVGQTQYRGKKIRAFVL